MPQVVTSTLLLYADNSCVLHQLKDVVQIEKRLNKDFENLCLSASKWRAKNIRQLNIKRKGKYKTAFGRNIS